MIAGPLGAGLGALLGALAAEEVKPLKEAIAAWCAQFGLQLTSLRRTSKLSFEILFQDSRQRFWDLEVEVPQPKTAVNPEQLDDLLYDAAVLQLEEWKRAHADATTARPAP